jgi:hypothetical protein
MSSASPRRLHVESIPFRACRRVQAAADRAPLTEVGQIFRMDMYHPGHPDGDYQTVNMVQVLDPPRAIGWLTGQEKGDAAVHPGPGHPVPAVRP